MVKNGDAESKELVQILDRLEHRNSWGIEDPVELGKRAVALAAKLNDIPSLGMAHYYLGVVCKNLTDYPLSVNHFERAEKLFRQTENNQMLATCYLRMGQVQRLIDNVPDAFDYFNYSILFAGRSDDKEPFLNGYIELGMLHCSQNALDAAEQCFNLVRILFDEAHHDKMILASMLNGMAEVSAKRKQLTEAEKYLNQVLDMVISLSDRKSESVVLRNLGRVFVQQGWFDQAVEMFEKSIGLGEEIGFLMSVYDGHKMLADCYEKMAKPALAAEHRAKAEELEKPLNIDEKKSQA
ncbi:MAG: tetratricopeptide repeat protein [Flavobacteriales bacterium]